jgi:hypothetical protein
VRRRSALALLVTLVCAICGASSAYGTDDTPAGAGLHLRVAPLTRGVIPNGRFVVRFSVNYSGPGRSGDIFLTFVAADGRKGKLKPKVSAVGLRLRRPYVPGATSMLVNGVSSRGTRIIRATFTLRVDGKICVRSSQAWLVENPSDFRARVGALCNYVIRHG